VKGSQKRFTCPKCGKTFTSWRPETLPGVAVKCYFCGNTFEDEAARRKPAAPPPPAAAAAAPTATPTASAPPAVPAVPAEAKVE
jgi:hypothetical protein